MSTRSTDLITAAAATAALFLAACGGTPATPAEKPAVQAPTAIVESATIPSTRSVAGSVRSSNVSPLAAKVMGNVIRVHVSEGDQVRAGQLLVEIDSREGRAQTDRARAGSAEVEQAIEAARANAAFAESTFNRYSALRDRQSVSPQEFDDVRNRFETARAELARLIARRGEVRAMGDQASAFLEYSFVRSPINGIVTGRFIDPGAQAAPGMPLVTVEDAASLRVETSIPESLQVQQGGSVTIESGGQRSEGKIIHVQPSLDGQTRSSLVKIAPATGTPLRSGQYVRVIFQTGERTAITVPPGAILRRGQLTSVFVVDPDGVARMRLVTLGEDGEILSGLQQGERIVTDASRVTDGARVS
ncbi:MAG TPA: efflux RND transporter periplasmic adaptor subunit [Thermoanaerobaculia bacterium]